MAEYLTAAQIAARAGIKQSTWRVYVAKGQAPKPSRQLSRINLWDAKEVEKWLKARKAPRPSDTSG